MLIQREKYNEIQAELAGKATLVAVSKTKPIDAIKELYQLGQRDFGENYVQELVEKAAQLPTDLRWHFIGHLQSNKVKNIIPFVHLIHGVDSLSLLNEINKQAARANRVVQCLLQIYIAKEETKFGLDTHEAETILMQAASTPAAFANIQITGLMGMASFTNDMHKVSDEFKHLKHFYDRMRVHYPSLQILSMGMSSDYKVALKDGTNMVRIGSLIFGEREYHKAG
jgi:hypothetical protein